MLLLPTEWEKTLMPTIRSVPVGSTVIIADRDGKPCPSPATIVSHIAYTGGGRYTLVGWKDKPNNVGWESIVEPYSLKDYLWGWWVSPEEIVSVVSRPTGNTASLPFPQGMQCAVKVCRDLNPYAVPNQPDGTYICRSCRQSGRKATT